MDRRESFLKKHLNVPNDMTTNNELANNYIDTFFVNYELNKLDISHPDLINLLIIFIFSFAVLLTTSKSDYKSNDILSILHTDQLRGLAIFFVVLGHLWVHVSKTKAQIILSGDAVSLFLLLSGFGLVISAKNRKQSFLDFCSKRIKRVMFPYWIATTLILILDYIILNKTLPVNSLLVTFIGINTKTELTSLDYVRWFITFVLLWYILFYVIFIKFQNIYSIHLLLGIAFILLPINYYIFHFSWYQFFSFPIGCALSAYYDKFMLKYKNNNFLFISLSIAGLLYILIYKILMSYGYINDKIIYSVPNILLSYLSEANSLIFGISIILISGKLVNKGFKSNLLLILGRYSYEIFLLHGVFLIKYNPVIKDNSPIAAIVQFIIFLLFATVISSLMFAATKSLYVKKSGYYRHE